MTTVEIKLTLPKKLLQEAEREGLLSPQAMERLLREEIHRRRVDGLFAAADRMAALEIPPLSDEEIEAEIYKARKPPAS